MSFRHVLVALGSALSMVVFVPAASAAITPSLTLDQSAGTQAGSSVALGTDIVFAPSGPTTDSVKNLTEILPPGLLSNASIDGGACLQMAPPATEPTSSPCQIGTGTAFVRVNDVLNTTQPLKLLLVAPPQPSDLAGIAIYLDNTGQQLGSTGDVTVRPTGDPAGVGLDIAFTNIPDTMSFGGPPVNLSVKELKTTIAALRMPTSCPTPGANYTIAADSYSDPTVQTVSQPLSVTGCSSLHITPTFSVSAQRDTADSGVQVTTDLQQPATADQAASRTVVLTLPPTVLGPNVAAVVNGGILCTDPTFVSCSKIGTALTTSSLFPAALTGSAYLTGSLSAPAIDLVFPPPFAITLSGKVDLSTGSTTFNGVPDLPLTDLQVTLAGGPNSVFTPSCNPASGTASTSLTAQNGDPTVTAQAPFTVANCPPPTVTGPGTGNGGGTPPPTKPPVTRPLHVSPAHLKSASLRRVGHDLYALRLQLLAGANGPGLRSVKVALPGSLRFAVTRGHRLRLRQRVFTHGVGVASIKLVHGRLLVALRHAVRSLSLSVEDLTVPSTGHAARRHQRRRLKLVVSVTDANGVATRFAARTLHVRVI